MTGSSTNSPSTIEAPAECRAVIDEVCPVSPENIPTDAATRVAGREKAPG